MKFKEFMFGQKKKPIEPIMENEIIETISFNNIQSKSSVDDICQIINNIIGKKVTFNTRKYGKSYETTKFIKNVRFTIEKDDTYYVCFDTDIEMEIPVDIREDIKIWGTRIISDNDPYAEEDWSR